MSRKNPAIRTVTIGLAVLLIIAKLFGFLREIIIAKYFGTGSEYDIYLIGVSIPLAIFGLFSYAFANVFIPTYSYAISSGDRKSGIRILWSDFNLSVVTAIILAVMMISVAPQIIRLIAPGLNAAGVENAAHILCISSVIIVIAVFESFFRSVLNAEKMFFIPAMAPIAANFVIISSILMFADVAGTSAILYGLVIGYALQMFIVFAPFARTGILRLAHMGFFRHHSEKFYESDGKNRYFPWQT